MSQSKSLQSPTKISNLISEWQEVLYATTGDIQRLDRVIRYSSIPFSVPEATSTHSFWVTLYSALICTHLGDSAPPLSEVLLYAVTHDIAEAVTGDVVRVLKYSTPELKEQVDRSEKILIDKMFPHLLKKISIKPTRKVKIIVKAADFMSLFHFMRREAARMNLEIIPFYYRMLRDMKSESEKVPKWIVGLYREMMIEAEMVGQDCFGKHVHSSRWYREI
jgi:5'-deoxynucleotidase YfbR-like HD superfamily hydrolase